jgi:hypothetical protein
MVNHFSHANVRPGLLTQIVGSGIAVLPSILFYFFIPFAARAIVTHVVADSEVESDVDEVEENGDMVEDEETALVQMR